MKEGIFKALNDRRSRSPDFREDRFDNHYERRGGGGDRDNRYRDDYRRDDRRPPRDDYRRDDFRRDDRHSGRDDYRRDDYRRDDYRRDDNRRDDNRRDDRDGRREEFRRDEHRGSRDDYRSGRKEVENKGNEKYSESVPESNGKITIESNFDSKDAPEDILKNSWGAPEEAGNDAGWA
jgi:hypothetical protein